METIYFPKEYKRALLSGKKNTTIRFGEELDKYKPLARYKTITYGGKPIGIDIDIESVEDVKLSEVPTKSRKRIIREAGRNLPERLQKIKFETVKKAHLSEAGFVNGFISKIAKDIELEKIRSILKDFKNRIGNKYDYFAIIGHKKRELGAETSSVPKKADPQKNAIKMHADLHKKWSKSKGYGDIKW